MKTKFNGILTLLLAFVVQISFAQERTISGTVSDSNGPLPGANVVIDGTTKGTETGFDGDYSIKAKTGDVLVFSFVGNQTVRKTVGASNTINVTMQEDSDNVLEEVVVTAQGIKREAKAIGYAVEVIDSKDIESKPETDVAKILTGKIAGVQVNSGGGFLGTATNVIIRSKNSISGNNQPLYIVDGAPIDGSRSFDIDPNNIASTTVLKGLAASTLYGNEGRNGVILITTKTGSGAEVDKKFEITYSNTTSILEVANLPEFQNTYGQGADNNINTTFFGTWGARFNNQVVPHHLSISDYNASFPEYIGATDIYRAIPNNVSSFFNKGFGSVNSLLISKNFGEGNGVSFGLGHSDQTGYIDENTLQRYNLNFGGRLKLSNNFSINTSVGYNKTNTRRPTRNFFTLLTWIPRNLDIQNLPFEDPNDNSSVYYRTTITNPRWQQKYTGFTGDTDRIFIKAGLDYDFNDKIKASYIYSLDNFSELNKDWYNRGAVENNTGFLQTFDNNSRVTNHRLSVTAGNYELTDKIKTRGVVGFEAKNRLNKFTGVRSERQIVFNFLRHSNFLDHSPVDSEAMQNVIGVYGQLEFDYSNYLYLTMSARNDWGSTTADENRSIFYPSVSLSFIPTNAFPSLKGDSNNYLKVRAGYGTSANFPGTYLTSPALNSNGNAFINPFTTDPVITNGVSSFKPNPDIRPELLKEYEIGLEGKMFNNFLDFNISAYKKIVEDQILSSQRPTSTGFSTTIINAGRIDTDGIEASIGLNLITSDEEGGFNWRMDNNFTAYETTVVSIPNDLINISSGVNYAIEGQPYGVFYGTYAARDDDGNLLINANNGKIIASDDVDGLDDNKIIGDPNEDWSLSNINTLTYKNFRLSMQWEYMHGGDIYSVTASNLLRRGVTRDTEDRERTYIIPGVLARPNGDVILDGNGQKIPNTIQIGANDLYFINLMDVNENIVFDATTLRLRDISLSYSLSEEMLKDTPFGSIVFSASGNNLWYHTPNLPKYMNLDPEVLSSGVGNGRGLDFQNDPSYKTYSLGVKLTF